MALEYLGHWCKTATGYEGRKKMKKPNEQKEKIQQALQEKAAERLKKAEEALTQAIANLNDNQAFISNSKKNYPYWVIVGKQSKCYS